MEPAATDPMRVVETWDASLRTGDWEAARATLADDATYDVSGDEPITCANADQIVALMRSWKGKLPDVEVVEWEPVGPSVLARLRQPAWGEDADWFQVLTVDEGLIRRLEDHPDREAALAAIASPT
jgi:SnoaL-like domain